MNKIELIWAKAKWILLSIIGVVLAIWYFLGRKRPQPQQILAPPPALDRKIQEAKEKALVMEAEIKIRTDTQVSALAEITQIDDGVERRKKLAEFLKTL